MEISDKLLNLEGGELLPRGSFVKYITRFFEYASSKIMNFNYNK